LFIIHSALHSVLVKAVIIHSSDHNPLNFNMSPVYTIYTVILALFPWLMDR